MVAAIGKRGRLDAAVQAVVGPAGGLNIDQQAEALFEGQFGILGDCAAALPVQNGNRTGEVC